MKKNRLLIIMLLALVGWGRAAAETVSPYVVDFETPINTAIHDFAVASNWRHIVPVSDYDGYGPYFMSYSYYTPSMGYYGIDGSSTLLAYRQFAGDYGGGEVVEDILVTPVVSGEVKMYVKASGMATSSNPSYVEFYKVNDAGTTTGDTIKCFTADMYAESDVEGWYTVSINVSTPQRIGIRAQHVYMDNFSATSAELVKEPKMTITGVTSPTGSTPVYYNQKPDGTVDINVKVKIKNDGEVDFVAGQTENYTLSLVKGAYYGSGNTEYDDVKYAIPVDLAIGEETEVEAVFNAPASFGTDWFYLKVKENITGSISSAKVQAKVQEYASKFIFDVAGTEYFSSSSATNKPIAFGVVAEATTLEYEIYNPGSAPLVINSFSLPAPFTSNAPTGEFTVAGGEKKVIAITFPATQYGIFADNLTIKYTNYGKEEATYTLGISGTVLDPNKNLITFDNGTDGQFPAGSIHSYQVYITSSTTDDVTNWYLQSTNTVTKFITPLLTAEAGEAFTYDSWYTSYNSSNAAVTVYLSKDRMNWTQVDKQTYYSGISNGVSTFTVTIPEAGDYYIAFELAGNALLDNIYGLTLAETPAHDWYLIGSDIPTTGKQNNDYTASIQVQNISAAADQVETATLYLNGEAVAVVNGIEMDGNENTAAVGTGRTVNYSNIEAPTTINFSFKPHVFGTFPAYIELKSGDTVLKTAEVSVTISEEKLENDVAVGEANSTSTYVPFHSPWMDDSNGSMSDFYYTKDQLKAFGIDEGKVITAITFRGTPTSTKSISSLTAEAWVGMQEAGTFAVGTPDKDNMTHVTVCSEQAFDFSTSEAVEFTIDLSAAPIVYDGVSDIRFYTNIDGHGQWLNINFEVDKNYPGQSFYAHGANPSSWSSTNSPVGYFALAVEAKMLTGVVSDVDGPVVGATVTIRNDENDIEYSATTDEQGAYTINVVQDRLTYTATVTADGYETLEDDQVLSFTEGSQVKDFTLSKPEGGMGGFTLGDVNHDGTVDINDVMAVVATILGNQPDVYFEENADLDGTNDVGVNDVMLIVGIILNGQ